MLLALTATLDPSGATNVSTASILAVMGTPPDPMPKLVAMGGVGTRRTVSASRSTTKGRLQAGGARSQVSVSGSVLSSVDADTKAITLPSALIEGARLARSACVPLEATLTRVVDPI